MSGVEGPSPGKRKDNSKLKLKIKLTKSGEFVSVYGLDETDGQTFVPQSNSYKADREKPVQCEQEHPDEVRLPSQHSDARQYSGCAAYDPRTKKKKGKQQERLPAESGQTPLSAENTFDKFGLTAIGRAEYCQGRRQSLKVKHSLLEFSDYLTRSVGTKVNVSASAGGSALIHIHPLHAETEEVVSPLSRQTDSLDGSLDTDVQQSMSLNQEHVFDVSKDSRDDTEGLPTVSPLLSASDQTKKCIDAQTSFRTDAEHDLTVRPCHQNKRKVSAVSACREQPGWWVMDNCDLAHSSVLNGNSEQDHSSGDRMEKDPVAGGLTEFHGLKEAASSETVLFEDNTSDDDYPNGLVIDLNDGEINNNSHSDVFPHTDLLQLESNQCCQKPDNSEEVAVQRIENPDLEVLAAKNFTGINDSTRGSKSLISMNSTDTCQSQRTAGEQANIDKPGPMFSKRCRCKNRLPQEFPDYVRQSKPNLKHKMCGKCMKRIPIPKPMKQTAISSEENKSVKVYNEHSYSRAQHREANTDLLLDVNREIVMFPDKCGGIGTVCGSSEGKPFAQSCWGDTTSQGVFTGANSQSTPYHLTKIAAGHWAGSQSNSQVKTTEKGARKSLKTENVKKKTTNCMPDMHQMIHNDFAMMDVFGLNPCYVVLERLPSAAGARQNGVVVKPLCHRHCRAESLEFLCEFGKLRHCKQSVLKHSAPFEPETKRTAVFNPKRDFLRCNKTLEGYEEYRQQQLQTRMEKLKESAEDTDHKRMYDNPSSSFGVFFPLSMLCAEGNTHVHIKDREVKIEQGLPSDSVVPSWSRLHSVLHDGKPHEVDAASAKFAADTQSEKEEKPVMCVRTSARRSICKVVEKDHAQDSYEHDCPLVSHKSLSSGTEDHDALNDFNHEYPDSKRIERDQLKMSKFEVKYYVFEADGRAFVVPFIRSGRTRTTPSVLDEEDLTYVKSVISLLLEEKSSCARLLEYPHSLKHKQRSRSVSRYDTREKEKVKPVVVGSASEFHSECLRMVATDPQVLNLAPDNPDVTPDEYLRQLGDEVFLYLSGEMEDAPPWIRELGKKIITKYKRRMYVRNRPKPSKNITIEIDYAVEDDNIDVGEEEDLQEASALHPNPALLPGPTPHVNSQTHETMTVGPVSTETSADYLVTQTVQSVAECAGQQTGSFVSEDVFVQEQKPSLADLLRLTHAKQDADLNHEESFQGHHITVPLPSGFGAVQTFGQTFDEQTTNHSASEYAPHSGAVDQKPLVHEQFPAPISVPEKPFPAGGQHHAQVEPQASQQQHTDEQNSSFRYAVIKEEPPDDGYPCVSSGTGDGFSLQQCQIKQELCDYAEQESNSFPFITASMFGPGVVELEKEVDNSQRDCVTNSSISQLPTVSQVPSNPQPDLSSLSPWMVPEFDQNLAVSFQDRMVSREVPLSQMHSLGKRLLVVPVSLSGHTAEECVAGHESESTLSCESVHEGGEVEIGDQAMTGFHAAEANAKGDRSLGGETLPVITSVCGADTWAESSEGSCPSEVEYPCQSSGTDNVPVISEVRGAGSIGLEWQQDGELEETGDTVGCSGTVHLEKLSDSSPVGLNEEDVDSAGLPTVTKVSSAGRSEEHTHENKYSKAKSSEGNKLSDNKSDMQGTADAVYSNISREDSVSECAIDCLPISSDSFNGQHVRIPLVLPHVDSASGNAREVGNNVSHPGACFVQQIPQGLGSIMIKQEPMEETAEGYSDCPGVFPTAVASCGTFPVTVSGSSATDLHHEDASDTSTHFPLTCAQEFRTITTVVMTSQALLDSDLPSSSVTWSSNIKLSSSATASPLSLHSSSASPMKKKSKKRKKGWSGKPSTNKKRKKIYIEGKSAEGECTEHFLSAVSAHCNCSRDAEVPASLEFLNSSDNTGVPSTLTSPTETQNVSSVESKWVQSPIIPTSEEEPMFDSCHETDDEVDTVPVFSMLNTDTGDVKFLGPSEKPDCCPVGVAGQMNEVAVTCEESVSKDEELSSTHEESAKPVEKSPVTVHDHESVSDDVVVSAKSDEAPSRSCNALQVLVSAESDEAPPRFCNALQAHEGTSEDEPVPPAAESTPNENSELERKSPNVELSSPTVSRTVSALASQVATVRMKKRRKPAKKGWGSGKKSRTRTAKKSAAMPGNTDLPSDVRENNNLSRSAVLDAACTVKSVQRTRVQLAPKKRKMSTPELDRAVISEMTLPGPSSLSVDRVTASLNTFLAKLKKSRHAGGSEDSAQAECTTNNPVDAQLAVGNLASGGAHEGVLQSRGKKKRPLSRSGEKKEGSGLGKVEPCPQPSVTEGKEEVKPPESSGDNSGIEDNQRLAQSVSSRPEAENSDSSTSKPRQRSFFDCLPQDFLSAWQSS